MLYQSFILTAPRPDGSNYLAQTMDTYREHFDVQAIVCAEPGSPLAKNSEYARMENPTRLGQFENLYQAFDIFMTLWDCPFMMLLEDDIQFCEEAGLRIRQLFPWLKTSKDVGYASAYCSKRNAFEYILKTGNLTWQVARMPRCMFCGNLCLLIPRSTVRLFLDHKEEIERLARKLPSQDGYRDEPVYVDYALSQFVHDRGLSIVAHMPTLVLHLGENSTYENNNVPEAMELTSRQPALCEPSSTSRK